jgi:DegV family protein with EDD domain
VKIITDTASLYTPSEAKELGITVIPACVLIDDKAYKDYEDITSEDFLEAVANGATPTSSQPAIGDVLDIFENIQEDVLHLSLGDGLSGAYQNAFGAKNCLDDSEHIHVIDTKTLAGPQHYLVQKALKLKEEGLHIEKIKEELQKCIETSVSFVIPADFNFLKRSGRLTPIAAQISTLIKIVPVMTQTSDKKRIEPFVIKRSVKSAVEAIIKHLKSLQVDDKYMITISHAGASEKAAQVLQQFKTQFETTTFELFSLSPALITHGGPGCIVIQAIMK